MYQCILHATDLRENHLQYCEQAHALAKSLHAELFFIHILNVPNSWQLAQSLGFAENVPQPIEEATLVMNVLGEQFDLDKDHLLVRQGGIKNCLIEAIELVQAELVIIGFTHHALFKGELTHMSESLAEQTICDVLLMREK